ncbi:MAG: DUF885 domain-containing protein, partial [Sphingomonadales bacterium]|nr:DUF885 domain-containing protein [Sphingomonadales bacterium]
MGSLLKTGAAAALGAALLVGLSSAAGAEAPVAPWAAAGIVAPVIEDERLMALFHDDARREDALDPMAVIYRGDSPSPQSLRQLFTDEQIRARRASVGQSLAALRRIDRRKLSAERQISYDVFQTDKRNEQIWLQPDMIALTAVRPFNHFGGLQIEFPSLVASDGALRYRDASDYRANLALIEAFGTVLDNAVDRFRQGLASGVVETRLTTANMIAQIDGLLDQPVEQSPFASPVRNFPAEIGADEQKQLRAAYLDAVRTKVYPAYHRLRAFLNDEYLPAAREQAGLSAMKGGSGLYRRYIAQHTTLPLDPEVVHKLGLSEVARIQSEMNGVKRELGYDGDLKGFFNFIRTDSRFHPKTRDDLANGYASVARKVDAQVPRFFSKVPRTPLLIEPYPAYREKYEAGGSYNQGSPDGSRPGVFFYNTYDLPSRFLSGITTLYLHEGAPGHHFQISLAQEDRTLPDFQRFGGNNAFVEGWALYAETLGYPMGFYKDPLQHWGTLDDEMLRAMRLVVDTGIHAKGWSRDQAIDYMLANSGMG